MFIYKKFPIIFNLIIVQCCVAPFIDQLIGSHAVVPTTLAAFVRNSGINQFCVLYRSSLLPLSDILRQPIFAEDPNSTWHKLNGNRAFSQAHRRYNKSIGQTIETEIKCGILVHNQDCTHASIEYTEIINQGDIKFVSDACYLLVLGNDSTETRLSIHEIYEPRGYFKERILSLFGIENPLFCSTWYEGKQFNLIIDASDIHVRSFIDKLIESHATTPEVFVSDSGINQYCVLYRSALLPLSDILRQPIFTEDPNSTWHKLNGNASFSCAQRTKTQTVDKEITCGTLLHTKAHKGYITIKYTHIINPGYSMPMLVKDICYLLISEHGSFIKMKIDLVCEPHKVFKDTILSLFGIENPLFCSAWYEGKQFNLIIDASDIHVILPTEECNVPEAILIPSPTTD